jgi:hypothetical protein
MDDLVVADEGRPTLKYAGVTTVVMRDDPSER